MQNKKKDKLLSTQSNTVEARLLNLESTLEFFRRCHPASAARRRIDRRPDVTPQEWQQYVESKIHNIISPVELRSAKCTC